jgi:hypothetical protein
MRGGASDRRNFRRSGIGEHGIISALVRPGRVAAVIDISAGGALIEISQQLQPGSAVDLQVDAAHRRTTLRGRVLRCAVACLQSTSVSYRAAIAFDRLWAYSLESGEYPVPTGEGRPSLDRVGSTRDVV